MEEVDRNVGHPQEDANNTLNPPTGLTQKKAQPRTAHPDRERNSSRKSTKTIEKIVTKTITGLREAAAWKIGHSPPLKPAPRRRAVRVTARPLSESQGKTARAAKPSQAGTNAF